MAEVKGSADMTRANACPSDPFGFVLPWTHFGHATTAAGRRWSWLYFGPPAWQRRPKQRTASGGRVVGGLWTFGQQVAFCWPGTCRPPGVWGFCAVAVGGRLLSPGAAGPPVPNCRSFWGAVNGCQLGARISTTSTSLASALPGDGNCPVGASPSGRHKRHVLVLCPGEAKQLTASPRRPPSLASVAGDCSVSPDGYRQSAARLVWCA
ncbi:hypothetical protein N658DRAFT_491276 [Parathielavia hyrcaniae]|uniref:Uncharacterized protein n=1 Tax=Parathielavia hyrcaniae TaxID=113614 RepID=A0AAN6QAK7_9PEZI|nr:hypothetical protein N658DRAFT_491276 [Parathielavia hyrcaniae]